MDTAHLPFLVLASCTIGLVSAQTPTAITYSGVQALDELNIPASADAYPWISADGLRLYFTQETADDDRLMLATRTSTGDPFGSATQVLPNEPIEQVSGSLSSDELTLWFTSGTNVRKAVRASTASPFGSSVQIALVGITGAVKSPTLTPDEQQMVLYNSGNVMLQKTGSYEYMLVNAVLTGAANTGPMKMSNDGLSVWFSAEYNGVRIPHRMSRAALSDDFSGLEYFAGAEFASGYSWIQPHLTPDGNILVGTRSSSGTWQGNDLFRAQGDGNTAIAESWLPSPLVFPNPARDRLHVRLPEGWSAADAQLIDARGRVCAHHRLAAGASGEILIPALPAGVYSILLRHGTDRLSERVVIEE
ncbi:MAG: T9SS type A sorting domain-containing protein [Flavobacteriales bacterium]|nr:T9SS type A sorting domain-containing protein [Flavobacteriales bacterium]